MGIRICVGIQKGGVGKTTTSLNLADCLVRKVPDGGKVLLVDMDPQRNTSKLLGIPDGTTPTVKDLLLDMENLISLKDVVRPTAIPRLHIVPSSLKLAPVESFLAVAGGYENPMFQLYSKLTREAVREFSYVIIDTPPSMGFLMTNSLAASDFLIIPMESGSGFSFDGIEDLLKLVNMVKTEQKRRLTDPHTNLEVLGLLLTKHDKRQTLCKAVQDAIVDKYGDDVFATTIAASSVVKKAEFARQTLMQYDRKSTASRDYMMLAEEVVRRTEPTSTEQPSRKSAAKAVVGASHA